MAEEIGVARKVLVDLRKAVMEPGKDWGKDGCCIVLTSSGIRRVQEALDIKVELCSRVEAEDKTEEMDVIKSGMINRKVVQCRRDNGEEVIVRVKDSKNFRRVMSNGRTMRLKARLTKDGWFMVGRCPRYPGRW